MNLLSDFFQSKEGGQILTEQEATVKKSIALVKKRIAFNRDVYKVKASTADGAEITLGEKGAEFENVDFVAGLWRVQTKFPYEITRVRDKDVVLLDKLPHQENTNFEYWRAKIVGYNCHGPFILQGNMTDLIVAKYDTDDGCIWGYGSSIESARAFLGLKLFDIYRQEIHRVACSGKPKQQK